VRQSNPQSAAETAVIMRPAESTQPEEAAMARKRYQDPNPKLVNGKWRIRWRKDVIGKDGKLTRQPMKTTLGSKFELPTYKMAKRAAVEYMEPINARDYRPGKVADLDEFAKLWIRDALPLLEGSTQSAAKTHINKHLLPILGDEKLENIRPQMVQSLIVHLSKKELGRKTILNILGTLQSMMREAKNWGYTVVKIESEQLILPREELKEEERSFTPEEAVAIINAAQGQWKAMFCLVAMTGIRRGEMIALRWSDIDLENRVIFLRRSYWQGSIKVLKTKSSKGTLPMPAPLVEMLRWHRSQWVKNDSDLVFASKVGTLLNPSSIYRGVFKPLLDDLKIAPGGFHAFRHQMASLMVSVGANPKVTQKQLRHSNIKTTLDVYAHLIGEDHRASAEKVGEILRPLVPDVKGKLLTVQ
jgi:integrase